MPCSSTSKQFAMWVPLDNELEEIGLLGGGAFAFSFARHPARYSFIQVLSKETRAPALPAAGVENSPSHMCHRLAVPQSSTKLCMYVYTTLGKWRLRLRAEAAEETEAAAAAASMGFLCMPVSRAESPKYEWWWRWVVVLAVMSTRAMHHHSALLLFGIANLSSRHSLHKAYRSGSGRGATGFLK